MLFQLKKLPEIIITVVWRATLANEKLLERASDNNLLLCRKSTSNKTRLDNDLIDV
jgi:hypothetical protein